MLTNNGCQPTLVFRLRWDFNSRLLCYNLQDFVDLEIRSALRATNPRDKHRPVRATWLSAHLCESQEIYLRKPARAQHVCNEVHPQAILVVDVMVLDTPEAMKLPARMAFNAESVMNTMLCEIRFMLSTGP